MAFTTARIIASLEILAKFMVDEEMSEHAIFIFHSDNLFLPNCSVIQSQLIKGHFLHSVQREGDGTFAKSFSSTKSGAKPSVFFRSNAFIEAPPLHSADMAR